MLKKAPISKIQILYKTEVGFSLPPQRDPDGETSFISSLEQEDIKKDQVSRLLLQEKLEKEDLRNNLSYLDS